MIKPSILVFLLVSFLLMQVSQGIRLEKGFMQVMNQNGGFGEVVVCNEGHCKGVNRKLMTLATPAIATTSNSENKKTEGDKSKSTSKDASNDRKTGSGEEEKLKVESSSSQTNYEYDHQAVTGHDNYVETMDYSPARRKPPIHN